jgi:hypothetical protein
MKIPERPEFVKSESVLIDGKKYPILDVEVLAGKQSEKTLLNFNWTLV